MVSGINTVVGFLFGMSAGFLFSALSPEEQTAVNAFNSNAVYQSEDGQLCLRDLSEAEQSTIACVDLPEPEPSQ